ncbi:hypothetical protein Goarm_000072 [Gossypium armourianum]|uniref:RNase H type-1 domain-containing protein n=1 Tax=Gossypium armourianum TaxID=34283 RepID=A0A7J9KFQ2_9ROSI|nr:hypothetical protein [Gossypium armourianum]
MRDAKVDELIDSHNRSWKKELITSTFSEDDAARILRIPLAQSPHEDFLVWGGEQSGEFTVRNAYQLLQKLTESPRAYALQTIYRNFYKKLWSLNLPTKIKVTWITWVVEKLSLYQGQIFCCALWAIWGDRNKKIHEGKVSNGTEVANFINSYINEINSLGKRDLNRTGEKQRWSYPQENFIKINFDGAYDKSQNRNSLLRAIQIGTGKGWQFLILEGDSLAIIKKCKSKGQDRSMVGAYIYDIQQEIYGFDNIRFQHTPRSANNLAHIFATETLKRGEEIYLDRGVPEYAMDQARYDGRRGPD